MAIVQTLIGNIKGPQGATGPQGEQGVAGNAATITVGTTSTTAYGNPAQVTNVGSSSDAILNFVIPQGRTGESVTELDDLTLNTITTATAEYPQIAIGDTGSTIFGKIVKFFQDLVSKKVDTSAVVNNFTTTQAGYVADARTVNTLMDALSNCLFWDVDQRMSISIPVTAGNWAYKNAGTVPTKAGYSFIGYYCATMNSTGVSPSYQKNSNDIWVYGRSSGTATIMCEPLFVKST